VALGVKAFVSLLLLTLPFVAAQQNPAGLAFTATLDPIRISGRPGMVVTRQFRLTLDPDQPRTHFNDRVPVRARPW
jgi:hypothetical protein